MILKSAHQKNREITLASKSTQSDSIVLRQNNLACRAFSNNSTFLLPRCHSATTRALHFRVTMLDLRPSHSMKKRV